MDEATAATPNADAPITPDELLKRDCDRLRRDLLSIEHQVRSLKQHSATLQPDTFPGQRGEMIAQSMLAVRHIEDARMRLGKVLQYARDGVSSYDKAPG